MVSFGVGLSVILIGLWAHRRPAAPKPGAPMTAAPGKAARGVNVPGRGFVWR